MFEADSQNFASVPSVPRGFTLQNIWPAFGEDHRGTLGGGGVPANPPPFRPPLPPLQIHCRGALRPHAAQRMHLGTVADQPPAPRAPPHPKGRTMQHKTHGGVRSGCAIALRRTASRCASAPPPAPQAVRMAIPPSVVGMGIRRCWFPLRGAPRPRPHGPLRHRPTRTPARLACEPCPCLIRDLIARPGPCRRPESPPPCAPRRPLTPANVWDRIRSGNRVRTK